MSRSQVALRKNIDIKKAVRQALADLGGMERFVRPGDVVLISPNLAVPIEPGSGIVTNPEVIVAVIEAARAAGAGKVRVAESAICGVNAGEVMEQLGVVKPLEAAGAEVLNLDDGQTETVTLEVPRGKLLKELTVYRPARECDLLISVPVMKTHIYAGVSLGMKNLKGTLPDEQKKIFHRIGIEEKSDEEFELDRCIADMMTVHHPGLTVMDASTAQEGFKVGLGVGGNSVKMDMVVAGQDYVSVDAVATHLMGFDPLEIEHIRYCQELGLGTADLERIQVLGDDPAALRRSFQPAVPGEIGDFANVEVIEGGSCSGCSFAVRWTLSAFTPEQIAQWGDCVFWVGSELDFNPDKKGRQVMIGTCACKAAQGEAIKIAGCPPPFFYIRDKLTQKLMDQTGTSCRC